MRRRRLETLLNDAYQCGNRARRRGRPMYHHIKPIIIIQAAERRGSRQYGRLMQHERNYLYNALKIKAL